MLFYIFLIFILLLISLSSKNNKKRAFYGGCIILFLSSTRSVNVGVDTMFYVKFFQQIAELDWESIFLVNAHLEKGFVIFCKSVSYVSTSEHWFLFSTSFISILPITIFLSKYSYNPCHSWIIYILSYQFDYEMLAMRQSMAMGICLMAFSLIMEKKTRKRLVLSILMCLFSASFHLGSLLLLPLFFLLYCIDIVNSKHYLLILLYSFIFFILLGTILRFLNYAGLIADIYFSSLNSNKGTGIGRILLPACILLAVVMFKKSLYYNDKNANLWELSSIFTILTAITSFWIFSLGRGVFYYRINEITSLPNLFLSQRNKNNKYVLQRLILGAYFITYIYFYSAGNDYVFWN